ncbi:ATP-binding protein [Brasilonema sp. UFV-L1]|uniref:sensor histidine kinase n=1 Tax=Brasilonema sp. UFV-L1 TaxID=2234130 RepID=UPI00145D2AE9|nr:ATP-binding protein [Brasilonema sp. UFV-L1]NMG08748.1 two-component sensor histidine kinase [Brasilonema sp. UFV-L1]
MLFRFSKSTIRARLTGWYIILLGCTLILFATYLYSQLETSLLGQLDTALKITASEISTTLVEQNGHPAFKITKDSEAMTHQLANAGFAVRLLAPNGQIWDAIGHYQEVPLSIPRKPGYINLTKYNKIWRVYSQPLPKSPKTGWLQIAQSLEPISEALEHLLTLMLFSCPLILLIAAFGGLFLAERALRPIDRIIRTAQAIGPNDFTQRIAYRGPFDEVGRLAFTIDRMLDRLQAAFEHERRFMADASHELRTPLTVIKGRIGVTLSRSRTLEEYENTLTDLQREVDRLIRLSNGLLFLTRLEQSELGYDASLTNVDLSHLLEVLIEQIQLLAEVENITIVTNIDSCIWIVGNCDHLTSIFLNLLDNAIKYTPNGGQVTVKAQQDRLQARIAVTNTGKGIEPEHLPHLFKRFYRVESARSRSTGGAGLGLAIAYEIVRLHHGTISVTSQPHQLTTFTVCLPLERLNLTLEA